MSGNRYVLSLQNTGVRRTDVDTHSCRRWQVPIDQTTLKVREISLNIASVDPSFTQSLIVDDGDCQCTKQFWTLNKGDSATGSSRRLLVLTLTNRQGLRPQTIDRHRHYLEPNYDPAWDRDHGLLVDQHPQSYSVRVDKGRWVAVTYSV
jgi:hypothetical protein